MMSSWPVYREDWEFSYATEVMEHVKAITRGIRNMRAEMNVPNNKRTKVTSSAVIPNCLQHLKYSRSL